MTTAKRPRGDSSLLYTYAGMVGDDAELVLAALSAASNVSGAGISLQKCELHKSTIQEAVGMQVRNCRWRMVDAANADLERSGWRDCEVVESRFTGAIMNAAHIARTGFSACTMNLLQCQVATLQDVRFEHCNLRGAYFNGSTMPGTVFTGSNLTGADFSGATITGCDFRRAIIEDIRIAPEQMQGVIVTSDQALYLARLFGLEIRE